MNAKEKAEELFTKFSGNTVHYDCTKKCALIAVDEIINLDIDVNTLDYWWWQEVKQEIIKL